MRAGEKALPRLSLLGSILAVVFLSLACGTGGGSGAGQQGAGAQGAHEGSTASRTEGQRAIATAVAARATESAARPATTAGSSNGAAKTATGIMASAAGSKLLDGRHLRAGKGCDSCHGALPAEGKPQRPNTTRCLSCHGGSYEALAKKTSALGAMNPHKSHVGKLDCDRCHGVHKPFEYSCNSCHSFGVPERFRSEV